MFENARKISGLLRDAVSKYRDDKIAATQRNAPPEELAAIEDRMNDAIWLLQQLEQFIAGGKKDE